FSPVTMGRAVRDDGPGSSRDAGALAGGAWVGAGGGGVGGVAGAASRGGGGVGDGDTAGLVGAASRTESEWSPDVLRPGAGALGGMWKAGARAPDPDPSRRVEKSNSTPLLPRRYTIGEKASALPSKAPRIARRASFRLREMSPWPRSAPASVR